MSFCSTLVDTFLALTKYNAMRWKANTSRPYCWTPAIPTFVTSTACGAPMRMHPMFIAFWSDLCRARW